MQLFLDQQQQFRQQMGGLLGQTPWTLLNQLTERNMELWKDFQKRSSTDPSTGKTRGIYSFFRTLSTMLLTRRSFFNSSSIFRQAWRTVVWSFLLKP